MVRFRLEIIIALALAISIEAGAQASSLRQSNNCNYSWWSHPIAIQSNEQTYYGCITKEGYWRVFKYANGIREYVTLQNKAYEKDDHNAPAIMVLPGKETIVAYTRHNASNFLNIARAEENTISFRPKTRLDLGGKVSYAQILSYQNRIVILSRVSNCKWVAVESMYDSEEWSEPVTVFEDCEGIGRQQYYLTSSPSAANPGLYHLAFIGHPGATLHKNITYATLDLADGNIYSGLNQIGNLDGTNLPLDSDALVSVGQILKPEQNSRLLALSEKYGKAVIYYARWSNLKNTAYYQAVYDEDNGSFARSKLGIKAGAPFQKSSHYVGGIDVSHTTNHIFVASNVKGKTYTLTRYDLAPDFTISNPQIVYSGSKKVVRPYAIYNSDKILYQYLRSYDKWNRWSSWVYLW